MATYRVVSLTVAPEYPTGKSSFTTDEDVLLRLSGVMERKDALTAFGWWWGDFYIVDKDEKPLNNKSWSFAALPVGGISRGDFNFLIEIGKFVTAGTLTGKVIVKAHG